MSSYGTGAVRKCVIQSKDSEILRYIYRQSLSVLCRAKHSILYSESRSTHYTLSLGGSHQKSEVSSLAGRWPNMWNVDCTSSTVPGTSTILPYYSTILQWIHTSQPLHSNHYSLYNEIRDDLY